MDVEKQKQELERRLHTTVKDEWLGHCLTFLEHTLHLPSLASVPPSQLSSYIEDQFLNSNLSESSRGCLPPQLRARQDQGQIKGAFLVQVHDLVNIAEPIDRRYQHSLHRTLKLGLFDGVQAIDAMELTHIPQLTMDLPAGVKIVLKDPLISRGMLVLAKENVAVLGGRVEALVQLLAARKASSQKSSLPKQWQDSLGQIADFQTDVRLDGDQQEQDVSSSPARRPPPAQPIALAPDITTTAIPQATASTNAPSTTATTPYRAREKSPFLAGAPAKTPTLSLGLPSRSNSSHASPSNSNAKPLSSLFRSTATTNAATSPAPKSPSAAIPIFDDDIEQWPDTNLQPKSLMDDIEKTQSATPTAKASPSVESKPPPELVDLDGSIDFDPVQAYIDRVESSQASLHASFHQDEPVDLEDIANQTDQYGDFDDFFAPDPEDYVEEGEGEVDMIEEGENLDIMMDVTEEEPSPKKPKLSEILDEFAMTSTRGPVDLKHRFSGIVSPPLSDAAQNHNVAALGSPKTSPTKEPAPELRLLSELQYVKKDRKYRVNATSARVSFPQVKNDDYNWKLTITDSSRAKTDVRLVPRLAEAILGFSSFDWENFKSDKAAEILEEAKPKLQGMFVLEYDAFDAIWNVLSVGTYGAIR